MISKKARRPAKQRSLHALEAMNDLPPHTIGQSKLAVEIHDAALKILMADTRRDITNVVDSVADAQKIARAIGRLVILELSARYGVMVPEDLSTADRRALARHQRTFKGVG